MAKLGAIIFLVGLALAVFMIDGALAAELPSEGIRRLDRKNGFQDFILGESIPSQPPAIKTYALNGREQVFEYRLVFGEISPAVRVLCVDGKVSQIRILPETRADGAYLLSAFAAQYGVPREFGKVRTWQGRTISAIYRPSEGPEPESLLLERVASAEAPAEQQPKAAGEERINAVSQMKARSLDPVVASAPGSRPSSPKRATSRPNYPNYSSMDRLFVYPPKLDAYKIVFSATYDTEYVNEMPVSTDFYFVKSGMVDSNGRLTSLNELTSSERRYYSVKTTGGRAETELPSPGNWTILGHYSSYKTDYFWVAVVNVYKYGQKVEVTAHNCRVVNWNDFDVQAKDNIFTASVAFNQAKAYKINFLTNLLKLGELEVERLERLRDN